MDIKWLDGKTAENKWILEMFFNDGRIAYLKGDYDVTVERYSCLFDADNIVGLTIYTPAQKPFASKTKDVHNRRKIKIAG